LTIIDLWGIIRLQWGRDCPKLDAPRREEMAVAVSKAQQKAVTKYVKSKYDRFGLTMPKGNLEVIKSHAAACGESTNSFIGRAISETMERDSGRDAPTRPQEAAGAPLGAGAAYLLSSDTLKAAQEAAQAAGEALPVFVARAVETQAGRDKIMRKMKGGNK